MPTFAAEFGGHGHAFEHELESESVFGAESKSDTKFFETTDTNLDIECYGHRFGYRVLNLK